MAEFKIGLAANPQEDDPEVEDWGAACQAAQALSQDCRTIGIWMRLRERWHLVALVFGDTIWIDNG